MVMCVFSVVSVLGMVLFNVCVFWLLLSISRCSGFWWLVRCDLGMVIVVILVCIGLFIVFLCVVKLFGKLVRMCCVMCDSM